MLEILRDAEGNIKAALEFYIVDSAGNMDDKGLYCWINDCEVSKSHRNNGCLKYFIGTIMKKYPQLQFGYFWREKYRTENDKWRLRMYSKNKWLKLIGEGKND